MRYTGRGRERSHDYDPRRASLPSGRRRRADSAAVPSLHPLQSRVDRPQVPHCGYCQNGMLIQAADLPATNKNPSVNDIRVAMNGHLCRCGTYPRILDGDPGGRRGDGERWCVT